MKDYEWQLIFPEIGGTLAIYQALKKKTSIWQTQNAKAEGKTNTSNNRKVISQKQ